MKVRKQRSHYFLKKLLIRLNEQTVIFRVCKLFTSKKDNTLKNNMLLFMVELERSVILKLAGRMLPWKRHADDNLAWVEPKLYRPSTNEGE